MVALQFPESLGPRRMHGLCSAWPRKWFVLKAESTTQRSVERARLVSHPEGPTLQIGAQRRPANRPEGRIQGFVCLHHQPLRSEDRMLCSRRCQVSHRENRRCRQEEQHRRVPSPENWRCRRRGSCRLECHKESRICRRECRCRRAPQQASPTGYHEPQCRPTSFGDESKARARQAQRALRGARVDSLVHHEMPSCHRASRFPSRPSSGQRTLAALGYGSR
mmetsp:Transcript_16322/g.41698  ORF Transcript_16322/g.41698 Transcript_16322/m.41698 type:complete len:221 (-) Transcript_16322:137-799(-)